MFLNDCSQKINADRDPDLGLDRVGRSSVKSFDPQMSLDPFEEQFYSPTQAVDIRYGLGLEVKVVGQEKKSFVSFGVEVPYSAEGFGIILFGLRSGQRDDLVALHSGILPGG